jgi:hypothetical protein
VARRTVAAWSPPCGPSWIPTAGCPGPPAADLAPVAGTPHWPAFLAGYRTVRAFGPADEAAVPWASILLRIDYLHFHLYAKPAIRGTASLTEGWVDQNLTDLRAAAERPQFSADGTGGR